MGERKVLNKYIPADFDPSLVPRGKKLSSKDGTVPVRMMLPFSIQCSTCYTFLYRGRKFNSRKEAMGGPDGTYLGITRWRFYIKCTGCARPITILTDPKNADYEMESGGTRNYEVYKDQAQTEQATIDEQKEDELNDPMKALENRVLESQKEMLDMDQLEQIRMLNAKHVQLLKTATTATTTANILHPNKKKEAVDDSKTNLDDVLLTEEDEELIRSIRFGNKHQTKSGQKSLSSSQMFIHRLDDDDEENGRIEKPTEDQQEERNEPITKITNYDDTKKNIVRILPTIKAVKKRKIDAVEKPSTTPTPQSEQQQNNDDFTRTTGDTESHTILNEQQKKQALSGLLGGYSSDSEES